jgi:GTP-binding protein
VKSDPLRRKQAEALALARHHPAAHPDVVATSSETGAGIADLRADLAALAWRAGS